MGSMFNLYNYFFRILSVYGFDVPDYVSNDEYLDFVKFYENILNHRKRRWDECYNERNLMKGFDCELCSC